MCKKENSSVDDIRNSFSFATRDKFDFDDKACVLSILAEAMWIDFKYRLPR